MILHDMPNLYQQENPIFLSKRRITMLRHYATT
jgi:hypothetical protein